MIHGLVGSNWNEAKGLTAEGEEFRFDAERANENARSPGRGAK